MILALLWACSAPGPGPRPAPAAEEGPIRVAVVMGSDERARGLNTAEAGARRVAEALREAGWRVETLLGARATAQEARAATAGLVTVPGRAPSPEDRFILYVSAHGQRVPDDQGRTVPALALAAGSVPVSTLLSAVDALPVPYRALVLDSCFPALEQGTEAGSWASRGTLVLTAAGAAERAVASVGVGGLYTDCLLQSWGEGSLLRAHLAARVCVGARAPGQRPQVYPPDAPVFDVPFGEEDRPGSLVLDGLSPSLPEGYTLRIDGVEMKDRGGLDVASNQETHEFVIESEGVLVVRRSRAWPRGALLGLAPRPDTAPGPDWIRLLPPAAPRDPVYREIADTSGLSAAVTCDRPQGAVAVSLDGVRPGWFVSCADRGPVFAVNVAPLGVDPSYKVEMDLGEAPRSAPNGHAPVVMDLDQDGRPAVCYLSAARELACVDQRGLLRLDGLLPSGVDVLVTQTDLDVDGDLDLLLYRVPRWEVWTWDAGHYRLASSLEMNPAPSWGEVLELDGDGLPDLLFGGGFTVPRLWLFGLPGQGRPWATALDGRGFGLPEVHSDAVSVGFEGRWHLATLTAHGGALYPVGRLPVGAPVAGPGERDERDSPGLVAGDLDLDGALDLIVLHRDRQQPPHRIYLRRSALGGWRLIEGVPGLDVSTDDQGVVLDDVDQDGDLDLLALNGRELDTPPEGCCRLWVSDAAAHSASLRVDIDPGDRPWIGAELALAGGLGGLLRLDGAHTLGAGLFGLGAGGVPGALTVRWPGGAVDVVDDPGAFEAVPGGYRVRVQRGATPSGRLLVGSWVVDLAAEAGARVRVAQGLQGRRVSDAAWRTPQGAVVHADGRLVRLDAQGRQVGAQVPAPGCAWGGWVAGGLDALVLGCSAQEAGAYTEQVRLWQPGRSTLLPSPPGSPTFTRGLALQGDRLWIASGRRRVQARAAAPGLEETGLRLAAPEGAVDRTWIQIAPSGEILVADPGASRVEVWAGEPPTLQRLISVPGLGYGAKVIDWDAARGAWLLPVDGGVVAVDPRRDAPVARWDAPGTVVGVVALEAGVIALLTTPEAPTVRVYDQPGATPRLVVGVPPVNGMVFLRLDR